MEADFSSSQKSKNVDEHGNRKFMGSQYIGTPASILDMLEWNVDATTDDRDQIFKYAIKQPTKVVFDYDSIIFGTFGVAEFLGPQKASCYLTDTGHLIAKMSISQGYDPVVWDSNGPDSEAVFANSPLCDFTRRPLSPHFASTLSERRNLIHLILAIARDSAWTWISIIFFTYCAWISLPPSFFRRKGDKRILLTPREKAMENFNLALAGLMILSALVPRVVYAFSMARYQRKLFLNEERVSRHPELSDIFPSQVR